MANAGVDNIAKANAASTLLEKQKAKQEAKEAFISLKKQTAEAQLKLVELLRVTNSKQQKRDNIWAWGIRLLAALIGVIFACLFQINAFTLLHPLIGTQIAAGPSGWVFTGIASSFGASFWHSIMDGLNTYKDTPPIASKLKS